MLNIPIVVVAYNRPKSVSRLLRSIDKANYRASVKLIISIDGGEGNSEVIKIAEEYKWRYGSKEVRVSDQNLGLRKHILQCGRLSEEFDGIIILEDDLYVAPGFYDYVQQAHMFYGNESKIAGISLYAHSYNETAWLPFWPLDDGFDVYFMQIACSWGQSWLADQWGQFEDWYKQNEALDFRVDGEIPGDLCYWPDSSWKKFFIKYMILHDKYFVYPRVSLSTNFADAGVNHSGSNIFQVPLALNLKDFQLPKFEESLIKYDAFCELIPDCIKSLVPEFLDYDLAVDLYGMKAGGSLNAEYIITSQPLKKSELRFARKLKPHEMNLIEGLDGEFLHFGLTKDLIPYKNFLSNRNQINQDYETTHGYWYALNKHHYKPQELKGASDSGGKWLSRISDFRRRYFRNFR